MLPLLHPPNSSNTICLYLAITNDSRSGHTSIIDTRPSLWLPRFHEQKHSRSVTSLDPFGLCNGRGEMPQGMKGLQKGLVIQKAHVPATKGPWGSAAVTVTVIVDSDTNVNVC